MTDLGIHSIKIMLIDGGQQSFNYSFFINVIKNFPPDFIGEKP
jgi:hypothetical protein